MVWWDELMRVTMERYHQWLEGDPMQRLGIQPPALTDLPQGFLRLDQRVTSLLLPALPKSLATEMVANRQLNTPQIIFRVLKAFEANPAMEMTLEQPQDPEEWKKPPPDVYEKIPGWNGFPSFLAWPETKIMAKMCGLQKISFHQGLKSKLAEGIQRVNLGGPRVKALTAAERRQIQEWQLHVSNGHLPFRRDCAVCLESAGRDRPRRRLQYPEAHTMSIDISGPHRKGIDQRGRPTYFMVVVYTVPVKDTFPLPEGLQRLAEKEQKRSLALEAPPGSPLDRDDLLDQLEKDLEAQYAREREPVDLVGDQSQEPQPGANAVPVPGDEPPDSAAQPPAEQPAQTRVHLRAAGLEADWWPLALRHTVEQRNRDQMGAMGINLPPLIPFGTECFAKLKRWHRRDWDHPFEKIKVLGPAMGMSPTSKGYYIQSLTSGKFMRSTVVVNPPQLPDLLPELPQPDGEDYSPSFMPEDEAEDHLEDEVEPPMELCPGEMVEQLHQPHGGAEVTVRELDPNQKIVPTPGPLQLRDGSRPRRLTGKQKSKYITELLDKHGIQEEAWVLCPKIEDGEPEENPPAAALKLAQQYTGELMWVASRTRPDIAYSVGVMSRLLHKRPGNVKHIAMQTLKYLRRTTNKTIKFNF
eukprot:s2797_g3.t1